MKRKMVSGLLLLAYTINAFARTIGESTMQNSHDFQGHLMLQGGGYWSHQGKAQHIPIESLMGNDFTLTKNSDSRSLMGVVIISLDRISIPCN